MKRIKVLIVIDSQEDTLLLLHQLQRGGYLPQYRRVQEEEEMRSALQEDSWDLVISNHKMSRFNSLAALKWVKERGLDLPFIILSGRMGEEAAVEAMKAGAHDYIMKSNMIRLLPVIERELRDAEIRRKKRETEKALMESEARLKYYLKNFPGILYQLDPPSQQPTLFEGRVLDFTGYQKQDFIKGIRDWSSILHPHDLPLAKKGVEALIKGEKSRLEMEYRIINQAEKTVRWIRDIAQRLPGEKGTIHGAIYEVTEIKKAQETLHYLHIHDRLTSLYNRAYLEEQLQHYNTKEQLPISIIMGDINGLKLINDSYGFSTGDAVLIQTTQILKRCCGEKGILARWGDDEFLLLLFQTSQEAAQIICSRIKAETAKAQVEEIPVRIALGSATKENPEENLYQLLQIAENRMHKQKLLEVKSTRGTIISTLLTTLGEKSHETEAHAWRLQKLALQVGEKIELSLEELDRLSLLLTLHDIGKINISEDILTKPGPLTKEEWELMKGHPETGYRIARSTDEFSHVADDIRAHHERWDGTGYPQGLEGEEIPLLARIATIVDSYDVMTNHRPYKKTKTKEEAITELQRCAGSQFDPKLVAAFIDSISE